MALRGHADYHVLMRSITVNYPTITRQKKFLNKVFVVEAIRDLDEAIDLICAEFSEEEKLDPFAEDLCPYFGILWPAAIGLATYISDHPELVKGKSVLELGAGLGLPSLVASHAGANVLATDYHPDAEKYFLRNCRHSSVECNYRRLNWRESGEDLGRFDVVLGSDVLYESKHPREVAEGLLKFTNPGGVILLSDPGRSYLQRFITAMNELGHKEELSSVEIEGKDIWVFKFRT